jgi:hypothetical protein
MICHGARNLFVESGATFSPDGRYRYALWRRWNANLQTVLFIMLNPSIADELENDPTVERCQRRAAKLGFGTMRVANIFGLRSTDPKILRLDDDPIGSGNDVAIVGACHDSDRVVCGWGRYGKLLDRGDKVLRLIRATGKVPMALKLNSDGTPAHPLYLPYSFNPIRIP